MPDNAITLIGNLVENPVLRITASGVSVCGFRLASTPRRFDRTEQRWVDGSTLYLRISCWRQLAENVAASLSRGDRALVVGRLRQNDYETQDGDRRVSYEIDAEAVAAELTWRPVEVRRTARSSSGPVEEPAAGDPFADPGPLSGDPFSADGVRFGEAREGEESPAVAGDARLPADGGGALPDGPVGSAGLDPVGAVGLDLVGSAGSGGLPISGLDEPTPGAATSESSLRAALTGPGSSAANGAGVTLGTDDLSHSLGCDAGIHAIPGAVRISGAVGGTPAVAPADQGLRLVGLAAAGLEGYPGVDVRSVFGVDPGHDPVAEAGAVPRLKALFDEALQSVEPPHRSTDDVAPRPTDKAARAPFRLMSLPTRVPGRAAGERPIGLADVVGERRLRGLGGATG